MKKLITATKQATAPLVPREIETADQDGHQAMALAVAKIHRTVKVSLGGISDHGGLYNTQQQSERNVSVIVFSLMTF